MSQDHSALLPVSFHDHTLYLVARDGEPFVPMRPLVEAMGLAWQSQREKLKSRYRSTVTEIVSVAEDGKQRAMTCLPLRKLPGWLMTIHPNKVRPELRARIRQYQDECDDVLWRYWSGQQAERAAATASLPAPTDPTTHAAVRKVIHSRAHALSRAQYEPLCRWLETEAREHYQGNPDLTDLLVHLANLEHPGAPRYDYPAETARPKDRSDDLINAAAWLHQIGSPLGDLLRRLHADGHNVDGPLIQFHVLRELLLESARAWESVQRKALDQNLNGVRWRADLPEALLASAQW